MTRTIPPIPMNWRTAMRHLIDHLPYGADRADWSAEYAELVEAIHQGYGPDTDDLDDLIITLQGLQQAVAQLEDADL